MTVIGGIGRNGGVGRPAGPAGPGRSAGAAFTMSLVTEEAGSALAATAAAPPAALSGMLALQEVECAGSGDRAARRHGQAILRELAHLQHALLSGGTDPAALARLADLASLLPEAADPGLAAAIRAVALRARIELARREINPSMSAS
ncbi:MAG TPA: flagellar assembly protein FliX [Acetobacteraceae bacterium]|nr:flagellar assembly protein FliX [Acetobacteraceae bacterium]